MDVGYIGLGKMGRNMVRRLLEKGYYVVATDVNETARIAATADGATPAEDIKDLIGKLAPPRRVWIMVPAGDITTNIITELAEHLDPGDVVINGGNEFYKASYGHGSFLREKDIHFIDVGVSGGQEGARHGACMMIGGEREIFDTHEGLFRDLAAPGAYQFFPGSGAGHYVKMVHNGIEYGMMQALAEGCDILKNTKEYDISLTDAMRIYNNESIITSRLTGWLADGYEQYGEDLEDISGTAGSGGAAGMEKSEAKWTDDVAKDLGISDRVIKASIDVRLQSQHKPNYQAKVLNTMRNMFGGHAAQKKQK